MSFSGTFQGIYVPPGVYTQTFYESPVQGLLAGLKIPVFIGEGSEILSQSNLEIVRGSSSNIDQRKVNEDMDGRAVSAQTGSNVTLAEFDGTLDKVQVRHYPIVTGDGTGTTATKTSSVLVTINDSMVAVLSIDAANGVLRLSTPPSPGDVVRVTYFFNRTDTLFTDTVSDQVTEDAAILRGTAASGYSITEDDNDEFVVTVHGASDVVVTTTISDTGASTWSASQVAAFINAAADAAGATDLTAATYENHLGETCISLTADHGLTVGGGSANTTLGFYSGQATSRVSTFYTFHGPIVDGTNAGVTTTDTSDVTVKVDGVQVIPESVDGASRAVTLPYAPASGSVVTITYYHNTWQDTFDYLAHINVTSVTGCGVSPGRSDYTEEVDFILQDDKILWGSAVTVSAGTHTTGTEYFDDTQISTTLVDYRGYLEPCTAVTDSSVSPPVTSTTKFTLPRTPTTGNGRSSPLGSSLFQTVSNSRIDLPTNRPDLVLAYWGYGPQDAIERGAVTVLSVDSDAATMTLASAVPVGATVYATFYYNTLQDQEYTVTVGTAGAGGTGTYSITDADGDSVLVPSWGSKSSGLSTITVQFPSGSERKPDIRFETPSVTTDYVGPVEETVTVTFSAKDSTLAKYAFPEAGPYYTISGASDHARIQIDGTDVNGSTGHDLSNHIAQADLGFTASYLGGEVEYDADTGSITYEIDATNQGVIATIDDVLITGTAEIGSGATLATYVTAFNQAVDVEEGTAQSGSTTTLVLEASNGHNTTDDFYNGWTVVTTGGTGSGQTATVSDYDGGTLTLTVPTWTAVDNTTTYYLYDPNALPQYVASGRFNSSVTIAAGEFDDLSFRYVGATAGASGTIEATIAAATYASASLLADAVESAISTAITGAGLAAAFDGLEVKVDADSSGRMVFKLIRPYGDASGYLEFITDATPAEDFAIIAGIDTAASGGSQTKLISGPIAKRFTIAGDTTSALLHDRMILRNRVMPGEGSIYETSTVEQCELLVGAGTGNTMMGLTTNATGTAGVRATVRPATMVGRVGWAGGQDASGQPIVTFYAAGGSSSQNNVFKFTVDGVPVSVVFTDDTGATIATGESADVPLGPMTTANTILNQIMTAMEATSLTDDADGDGLIWQEGAGIRLVSATSGSASSIVIGSSSANGVLGFTDGATASRTPVSAEAIASSLMGHVDATVADSLENWTSPDSGAFAGLGLAGVVTDASNADYVFIQSQGTSGAGTASSVAWAAATADDVLLPGTGVGAVSGDGSSGEAGISGYYVTSSDTDAGSGTVNNSVLNNGTGQDGIIGQTYRDLVTGLTFVILERDGGANYPDAATVTFNVKSIATTDGNLPTNAIPGVEMVVMNTLGVGVGDTAVVETFERSGSQPSTGDLYYVSYEYTKEDFSTALFTKFSAVEAAYGSLSTDNPVTLASFLAITNGAVLLGVKQVQKDTDANGDGVNDTGSSAAFRTAIDDLKGEIAPGTKPDMLVPLKGDDVNLFDYLTQHCDVQSTIRHQSERTAVCGFSAGTQPATARAAAEAIGRTRMRLVYPDIATVSLPSADGNDEEVLVDGPMLVAGLIGRVMNPTVDVATPWTGRKLFGYQSLARTLDAVDQNLLAQSGVTVLEDKPPVIRIRHGVTTDTSELLQKLPTVVLIADEVHRQARGTLERFIGQKFLPGMLTQIESRLSYTLKLLVEGSIIAAYTGVSANTAEDDPTVAEVEAYIQPVFPLLYIIVTFNLRTQL